MGTILFGERNSGVQIGTNNGSITVESHPSLNSSFFKTSNYESHKNINPSRVRNTCGWFLNHHKYREWKNNDREDLLWLSADPGCGKSVLSRALVDEILIQDPSATICYFFFKDNEEQNSTVTALCALLHQLFSTKPDQFRNHAENAIRKQGERLRFSFEPLWELWISSASDPGSGEIICVLDALDECRQPDRDRIIQELVEFYTISQERPTGKSRLKFLVTSRPYVEIERRFGKLTYQFPSIRLAGEEEWRCISEEIGVVIDAKVDEIAIERGLTDDVREALKRRLSEGQNRTYLWLHLTLEVLRDCLGQTKSKLLRHIDQLPDSVEQAYDEILRRCSNKNKPDARRLLEILVAAQRPLDLAEIDVALEVRTNFRSCCDMDLEGQAHRKKWIRDACGLFVSILDSRVHLIHQTAREFLLRQADEEVAAGTWRHSIDLQNAHSGLAKLCIKYLLSSDFRRQYQEPVRQSTPQEGFLDYSANYWTYHVRQVVDIESEWVCAAAKLCEVGNGSFSYWMGFHQDSIIWKRLIRSQMSSLYWATHWKLVLIAEFFINKFEIKLTDEVIQKAAKNGSSGAKIMELLLDRRGAETKITDEVVQAAARNWSSGVKIIELLLDRRGAEIKITDEVVLAAVGNGSSGAKIMELLLDRRGAEIKITGGVVQAAVGNEYIGAKIIELLLDRRGAETKITDEVVQAAARNWSGGAKIMELLLDRRGAEIKITGGVVQAAVGNEYIGAKIIELLLDRRGAEIKITDEVVLAAVGNGSSGAKIMELLLSRRGAETKITDEIVQTAARNWSGGVKIIELLLDRRGAEIKITDDVVLAAVGNGFSGAKIMELLLDRRGAEIKITDDVVLAAVGNESSGAKIMELLLDRRGAEIKITAGVVQAAVGNESSGVKIMELLLDRQGAEMNISNEIVRATVGNRSSGVKIMELLLDRRGAEIKITDEVARTVAGNIYCGAKIMKFLLNQQGAEVEVTNEVVRAAAENPSSGATIMELLLNRRGAEIKITDEVVQAAARNWSSGAKIMELLLNRRGAEIKITDKVVQEAVGNLYRGATIMEILLDRRGDEIKITDEVVQAAARNQLSGTKTMELLLDRRGAEIKITDKVVQEAVGNLYRGATIMEILLDRRGDEIKITDEVVQAAAKNQLSGTKIMELLLDR
ncbi:hypothetical protein N7447_004665 [Penicillium robsamsonii]|uniref:uncharacterized protein n=1 Tax=Penicillium robsamsonii TaxID=1792511 RepID=UPI00254953F1|nr:uncharacterized protein N7447_004665 [Penicillium robsamsonii]KAJ5827902.1 hypothetical protein N7447_004665 [Penicillium robsamsonii]